MPKYNDFDLDLQKSFDSTEPSLDTSGTNFCTKLSYGDCKPHGGPIGSGTCNKENI